MQVNLLVGTNKGAFFFQSDEGRRNWRMTGPHLADWDVYSLLGDNRHGPRILAGANRNGTGGTILMSEDFGETWTPAAQSPRYPETKGIGMRKNWIFHADGTFELAPIEGPFEVKRIWQLVPGHPSEPDTYYAGVEEAGLFVSRDRGATWQEVEGLTNHPTRAQWGPGAGGLCLHTILIDPNNPDRMWAAMSAVGVFRTDDGGGTWKTCNKGLTQAATGQPEPEIGCCAHKITLSPERSDHLYMQDHMGVFRSTDGADSWQRIEDGLHSNYGFPIAATRKGDYYLIPLGGDEHRVVQGGGMGIYRWKTGGNRWEPVGGCGLPEEPQFVSVLRDALAVDPLDPAGLYFGTNAGEVFYSWDEGKHWDRLPAHLPRITCVKTWMVG